MAESLNWWLAIYYRVEDIMAQNDYKSCTIVSPGRRFKRMIYLLHLYDREILKIIDKDPYLEDFYKMFKFFNDDAIFGDVPLEGDVVISCHAEKHYPINYKNHIAILHTQPNKPTEGREIEGWLPSNCTTEEHFDNVVERYEFGGYDYMIENEKGRDNFVLLHIQN